MKIVKGLRELQQNLGRLQGRLRRSGYTEAVKAGADEFLDEIERRAPRDTGALSESFVQEQSAQTGGKYAASISVRGTPAGYYRFQEYGTKYHKAQAFIEPAIDAKTKKAVQAFTQSIQHSLSPYLHR